jgi:hypothetical protein
MATPASAARTAMARRHLEKLDRADGKTDMKNSFNGIWTHAVAHAYLQYRAKEKK